MKNEQRNLIKDWRIKLNWMVEIGSSIAIMESLIKENNENLKLIICWQFNWFNPSIDELNWFNQGLVSTTWWNGG